MSTDMAPGSGSTEYRTPAGVRRAERFSIAGKSIRAEVTADWVVLREQGVPKAEIFYTSYVLPRAGRSRPITFLFNGGPGAASAYLHLGAAAPLRVSFGAEGTVLPPPYELVPNDESWLPFTDLVFVDPVGTGLSRTVLESRTEQHPFEGDRQRQEERLREIPESRKLFFGIKKDLQLLSDFVSAYLDKERRWGSPVHVAGESYGGFRVGKLARLLPERGIPLSSVSLVSPVIDFGAIDGNDYDILTWVGRLPSMAMAARFHGKTRGPLAKKTINEVRRQAEIFAEDRLAPVLMKGGRGNPKERTMVLAQQAELLGLPEELVVQHNGRIPLHRFARALLAGTAHLCGLYDASIVGEDPFPDREGMVTPDPTLGGIAAPFTSGINQLLRDRLGLRTNREYLLLNEDVYRGWSDDRKQHYADRFIEACDDLRFGLAASPNLQVLITHGYYDLVTPYFSSIQSLGMLRLSESAAKRITLESFQGGHMFYTWKTSRQAFTARTRKVVLHQ